MFEHMDNVLSGNETAPGFPHIDFQCPKPSASLHSVESTMRIVFIRCTSVSCSILVYWMSLSNSLGLIPSLYRACAFSSSLVSQGRGEHLAVRWLDLTMFVDHLSQRYHQDSYYIPTLPNTLLAAWVAISEATEENGCLWFRVGSQSEPLYPQPENPYTHVSRTLEGVFDNETASVDDTSKNQLAGIADRYPEVSCPAKPGDAIFFYGNILHRSHANNGISSRRAFAGHYCDARSFVPWNAGEGWEGMEKGKEANGYHILARGDSHLPFAKPRFGTPCAAIEK